MAPARIIVMPGHTVCSVDITAPCHDILPGGAPPPRPGHGLLHRAGAGPRQEETQDHRYELLPARARGDRQGRLRE